MAKRNKTPACLHLPTELTIFAVAELLEPWQAWLAGLPDAAPAPVRADAVDQVDAAGLQLLLSLQRTAAARGHGLQLQRPSGVLRAGCEGLGLGPWLQVHTTPAEGVA